MGASVIAGMDAAPILGPAEHVFDLVALTVEGFIVIDLDFAVGFWRDARRHRAFGEGVAEPFCVITLVAKQGEAFGKASIIRAAPL